MVHFNSKRRIPLILLSLFIIGLGPSVFIYSRQDEAYHENTLVGLAIALDGLQETTKDLEASFSAGPKSSGKTVKEYLRYLKRIQKHCDQVTYYSDAKNQAELPDTEANRLKESASLCQDLSKLATASESRYAAVSKLLTASAKPRRYQKFPLFRSNTRKQHESAVSSAQNSIKQVDMGTVDFPFSILSELNSFETALKDSQGLDYMPSLNTFQQRVLGERQQYWMVYADLPALEHLLSIQHGAYCQALGENRIKQCPKP